MASSSSALPVPGGHSQGIELTDRKSAQYDNREILMPQPGDVDRSSDGSDGDGDESKSTNIDRWHMERMGESFSLPLPDLALR